MKYLYPEMQSSLASGQKYIHPYDGGVYEDIDERYDSLKKIKTIYLPRTVISAKIYSTIEKLYLSNGITELLISNEMQNYYGSNLNELFIPESLKHIISDWEQFDEVYLDPKNENYTFINGVLYEKYVKEYRSDYIGGMYKNNEDLCDYEYEIVWRPKDLDTIIIENNIKIGQNWLLDGIKRLVINEGVTNIALPNHNGFNKDIYIDEIVIPQSFQVIENYAFNNQFNKLWTEPVENMSILYFDRLNQPYNIFVKSIVIDDKNIFFVKHNDNLLMKLNTNNSLINKFSLFNTYIINHNNNDLDSVLHVAFGPTLDCYTASQTVYYRKNFHEKIILNYDCLVNGATFGYELFDFELKHNAGLFKKELVYKFDNKDVEAFNNYRSGTRDKLIQLLAIVSKLIIKESVVKIDSNIFNYCKNLKHLVFEDDTILQDIKNKSIDITKLIDYNRDLTINGLEIFQVTTENKDFIECVDLPKGTTIINDASYSGFYKLSDVRLPDGLKIIGKEAFKNCESLTKITIPDSVEEIDIEAFAYCSNLVEVKLPSNLLVIRKGAFRNCKSLIKIEIPNKLTMIEEKAFLFCDRLTVIQLSEKLITLEPLVFAECKSLEKITLPNSVESIDKGVFEFCNNLSTVHLSTNLKIIGDNAFINCKSLVQINIPNTIENIGAEAFSGCESLTEVILPDKLQSVSNGMLRGCKSLNSISIPSSIESIGSEAFSGCESLTEVILPDKLQSVSNGMLRGCKSLNSISIPSSIESIGSEAFSGCERLTEVILPDKLQSVSNNLFKGCKFLKVIEIPKGVKTIESESLSGCELLKELVLPNNLISIGSKAFDGCASIKKILIPKSVETIGSGAFRNTRSLKIVDFEEESLLKTIEGGVFWYASALKHIVVPKNVENIRSYAFQGCQSLISVYLPKSVKSLWEKAIPGKQIAFGKDVVAHSAQIYCEATEKPKGWSPKNLRPKHWGVKEISKFSVFLYVVLSDNKVAIIGCENNSNTSYIDIPKTIKGYVVNRIHSYAFIDCIKFSSIFIPKSISVIEVHAFVNFKGTIYVEADSKPDGWADNWNSDSIPVEWGYQK
ncbi:MAG: leucine-rich repeat protein [Halanaerobiales bacterium]